MPKTLSSILFILSVQLNMAQEPRSCEDIFEAVYSRWDEITSMQYHSHKVERHFDETVSGDLDFTIQRDPFKVAARMTDKGHWILFDPSMSQTDALYISNGFPYTNLMLDVNGKVFRGPNHYTISDAGCEFVFEIIRREYERIPDEFTCYLDRRGSIPELVVHAETENFHWRKYTGKEGETVLDVAAKHSVSAYMILERNASLSQYQDDCEGIELEIPSHYGSVVDIRFDAEHLMPTSIENQDERGVYERYEYTNYRFNVELDADFFTEDHLDDLD